MGGRGWNKVGIEKEESLVTSSEEPSKNRLAHLLDEKSIPPFKIGILWTMGDSIPNLVPTLFHTQFLLGSLLHSAS